MRPTYDPDAVSEWLLKVAILVLALRAVYAIRRMTK